MIFEHKAPSISNVTLWQANAIFYVFLLLFFLLFGQQPYRGRCPMVPPYTGNTPFSLSFSFFLCPPWLVAPRPSQQAARPTSWLWGSPSSIWGSPSWLSDPLAGSESHLAPSEVYLAHFETLLASPELKGTAELVTLLQLFIFTSVSFSLTLLAFYIRADLIFVLGSLFCVYIYDVDSTYTVIGPNCSKVKIIEL